jgi:hypothetical protein
MTDLKYLADRTKRQLNINYDLDGVKFLEGFIERTKNEIPKEEWDGLINSCSAFLGQSIIECYGGKWVYDDNGTPVIDLGDKNQIFPFAKVSKQFEYGLGDSISSLFSLIPTIYKIQPKTKKKKWWQF